MVVGPKSYIQIIHTKQVCQSLTHLILMESRYGRRDVLLKAVTDAGRRLSDQGHYTIRHCR